MGGMWRRDALPVIEEGLEMHSSVPEIGIALQAGGCFCLHFFAKSMEFLNIKRGIALALQLPTCYEEL